jgi:hypothetical protein
MSYGIYESGSIIAKFVAPMTVRSNKPVFASDTLSLSRVVSERTAQRWEIETHLEPLSFNAQDLMVNLVTKGSSVPITVIMPQNYGVILKRTSTSTPTAVGSKDSSIVSITNNVGLICKGTFVKFSNHNKVYMTTTNLTNTGSLGIYPPLLSAVNTTMKHRDDVEMTCYYDLDIIKGMIYSDGIVMDTGSVKIIEKVP